jgi:hypothetical protein
MRSECNFFYHYYKTVNKNPFKKNDYQIFIALVKIGKK